MNFPWKIDANRKAEHIMRIWKSIAFCIHSRKLHSQTSLYSLHSGKRYSRFIGSTEMNTNGQMSDAKHECSDQQRYRRHEWAKFYLTSTHTSWICALWRAGIYGTRTLSSPIWFNRGYPAWVRHSRFKQQNVSRSSGRDQRSRRRRCREWRHRIVLIIRWWRTLRILP